MAPLGDTSDRSTRSGRATERPEWMLGPEAFASAANDGIEVLQTHISHVYLVGEDAYKLKKPVRFSFLDFSTRERREQACRQELRLNRRLCPWLYRDVVPIVEEVRSGAAAACPDGRIRRLATQDEGSETRSGRATRAKRVVDWAVHMRRLPAEHMMDRRLAEGEVDTADVVRLAEILARFHENERLSPEAAAAWARAGVFGRPIRNTLDVLEGRAADMGAPRRLAWLRARAERALEMHGALFARRAAEGWVVDGHGDLRPENICLTDPPAIFDCVEFSTDIRHLDCLSDISFLYVTLEGATRSGRATRRDLARAFLDAYLAARPGAMAAELFELYCLYRALVRVKVETLTADDPEVEPAARAAARKRAGEYLDAALRYSLDAVAAPLGRPVLLAVAGISGSGKTTLAATLAERLNLLHLATDGIRPQMPHIDDWPGGRYGKEAKAAVYEEMFRRARAALASGGAATAEVAQPPSAVVHGRGRPCHMAGGAATACRGVLLDATFLTANGRRGLRELAAAGRGAPTRCGRATGIVPLLIELEASEDLAAQRIAARQAAGRLHGSPSLSEASVEIMRRQRADQEPASASEGLRVVRLPAARPTHDLAEAACEALAENLLEDGSRSVSDG